MPSNTADNPNAGPKNSGKRPRAPKNIVPPDFGALKWDTRQEREQSIQTLYRYAEENAQSAISWYLDNKNSKSLWSRVLRFAAIGLATLGGLAPVIASMSWLSTRFGAQGVALIGQMGYLWLALAAASVATDKFFGFSSGWMRYIKTAQILMKGLSEFRLDWAMLMSKSRQAAPALEQSLPRNVAEPPPTMEQTQLMIQRIKDFVLAVDGQVEQETLTWIAEFQTSLAEIERSVKTQEEASKPGAIDVTVTNGMEAEAGFQVVLDGMVVAQVRGTRHQIGYVAPGQHKITVTATVKDKQLDASELVSVAPGAIAKATLALPVEEAQP
jgi:hypothetical protein